MNVPLSRALLALPLLCLAAGPRSLPAQSGGVPPASGAPATAAAQTAQPATDAAAPLEKPSSLIAPAVDHLSQVVSQIQLERWKGSSRDETDANLRSIERNLKTTLPDLVTAADARPASTAVALPLLRNLNALCAVMIRVSVTARANAPTQQAESIAGALTALQNARNSLSDQVETIATAQEKQISSLNSTVATLTARLNAPPPPPPPPPATKPAPKRKRRPAAPKPAAAAQKAAPAPAAPAQKPAHP